MANDKAEYVKRAANTDKTHHCHWPECNVRVKPAMWGCSKHWFTLPSRLRARIWETYKPGQEIAKNPSPAYLAVAVEVQTWIREVYPGIKAQPAGE